jgi:predicted transcriptional regulator
MATASLLDRLVGITPKQRDLLKTLTDLGGSFQEELAVKVDRIGENLAPDLEDLIQRKLVDVKKVRRGNQEDEIYQTAWDVRSLL